MFALGIALVGKAADRLESTNKESRWMIVGGLLLLIGLLGTMVLIFASSVALNPGGVEPVSPSWFIGLATAWAIWPGLICASIWLRRRPARQAIVFLWLTQSAAFPITAALSFAMGDVLPRSL